MREDSCVKRIAGDSENIVADGSWPLDVLRRSGRVGEDLGH
jgi:hypothetical protein